MNSNDPSTVRWAILGTGAIAHDFALALPRSREGRLRAVGSTTRDRAAEFASGRDGVIAGSYAEVIANDDIDAIYVATTHPTHAKLTIAALSAGKAVLCEKPAALTAADLDRVLCAATEAGVPFAEAYKYRFGPFAALLHTMIADGAIGAVRRVSASASFAAGDRTGRLFDPALAGGAIFDMGGYPASFAIAVARWAGAAESCEIAEAGGAWGSSGVDESAWATLQLGEIVANVSTSIVEELSTEALIVGTHGSIELAQPWGTRTASATTMVLNRNGAAHETIRVDAVDPFASEADALGEAIRHGHSELSEMGWAESRAVAGVLSAWRAGLESRLSR